MGNRRDDEPELVRAAATLEEELVRLEELSRSVRKIRLTSEKNITRAAKELREALSVPERVADGLRGLAQAMEGMQARQHAALEPLAAAAADVQKRTNELGELMQAFAALGTAAGEVASLLQSNGKAGMAKEDADARLGKILEGARTIAESARAADFPEVSREADTLRQKISALRERLQG